MSKLMYALGYAYQMAVMVPVIVWVNVTEFMTCRIKSEAWADGRSDAQKVLD